MLMTGNARRAFPTIVAAIKLQEAAEKEGDFRPHHAPYFLDFNCTWLDLPVDVC